jgi:hypothetical protein
MSNWVISSSDFQSIKSNLMASQQKLNEMLEFQNKQAVLKQELSDLQTEIQYFNKYYMESSGRPLQLRSFYWVNADRIE